MRPIPVVAFARTLFLVAALAAAPLASFASANATVSATVLDSANQPVGGVRIVFSGSAGSTFTAYTDRRGRAAMKLPVDTYTIVASRSGYAPENITGMEVAANASLSITLTQVTPTPKAPPTSPPPRQTPVPAAPPVRTATPVAAAPTPSPAPPRPVAVAVAAPTPAPPPVARPTPALAVAQAAAPTAAPRASVVALQPAPTQQPAPRPPPMVHDALLATYDAHHPEHVAGEPYFGRYTYVLLTGSGANDPRNRALVAALVARFGVASSNGNQTVVGNSLGYNVFFLPVKGSMHDVTAGASTVDAMLAEYDFKTAAYLRDRYCGTPAHTESSICEKPSPQGPFMLTLTRPLEGLRAHDPFPATFAYDFSAVSPEQYATAVAIIAVTATVQDPIQADQELTPAELAKYIGPAFVYSGAALRRSVPSLRVTVDNGLLG